MTYRPGDYWVICDRSGRKVRSSDTVKEWNGLRVHRDEYETRHPQDFVRGRVDRQRVPDARPEPPDSIVGPLTTTVTTAKNPGAVQLPVESSARFEPGDNIGVMLANGDLHRAVINTILSGVLMAVTAATKFPNHVSVGALVINYDAVAEAIIE